MADDDTVLSYVKAESNKDDIPNEPTFVFVDKWASLQPDKDAFVIRSSEEERESISWQDLKTASENLAIWLKREYHLEKGDRVGILSVNRLAYVLLDFALSRLGVVSVRLYVTMNSKVELTRSLGMTECRLFVCQYDSLKSVSEFLPLEEHDANTRFQCQDLPKLEYVVCLTGETSDGTTPLPEWHLINVTDEEHVKLKGIESSIGMDDDCSMYSTSGSTGLPKFVVLSYAGVITMWSMLRLIGTTSSDRYVMDRPMAHIGGNLCGTTIAGATMIVANPWKTASGNQNDFMLTVIKQERVTCGLSFPYVWYDIVQNGTAAEEMRNLGIKYFIFGGQVANAGILKTVKDRLGIPMVHCYGSTEVGCVTCTQPSDPFEIVSKYTGLPMNKVEIKIVNQETGEILPREEKGSVAIKCHHKWYYLKNEAKMRESHDKDGFFYPGDIGKMSENGHLEIFGRSDDMMSIGTVKVFPGPVEIMIGKHPAVDKALVFGVPDERLHEVIGAVVVPKQGVEVTSDEISEWLNESVNQSDLMTGSAYLPKHVWIEHSLPVTQSGKIDKKTLRSRCLKKLGL